MIVDYTYFKNEDIVRPIQFTRPIIDNNGNIINNYLISDNGLIYDKDEYESKMYYSEAIPAAEVKYSVDEYNNRVYVYNVNVEYENPNRISPLPRVMLIAFDEEKHDKLTYYKNLEANHIDPTKPLNNNLENLEFISHNENMRKAAETGVMIKKYNKELINNICQDIANKVPRQTIMKKYNVNYQLVDDIHAGRSHKCISEKYINKGFVYNAGNKIESKNKARKVCELLEKGYRNIEIINELKSIGINVDYNFIGSIKSHIAHNDISKNYNF